MKKIIIALVLLILCCIVANSYFNSKTQKKYEEEYKEFSKLSSTYYETKDINNAIKILRYLDSEKKLLARKNAQAPLIGLVAGIISSTPNFKTMIANEEFSSDITELIQNAEINLPKIKDGIVNSNEKITAATLDTYWAYYDATGDINAVRKITQALDPENNREGLMVTFAAIFSLQANAKKHPEVAKLIKEPEIEKKITDRLSSINKNNNKK